MNFKIVALSGMRKLRNCKKLGKLFISSNRLTCSNLSSQFIVLCLRGYWKETIGDSCGLLPKSTKEIQKT